MKEGPAEYRVRGEWFAHFCCRCRFLIGLLLGLLFAGLAYGLYRILY